MHFKTSLDPVGSEAYMENFIKGAVPRLNNLKTH